MTRGVRRSHTRTTASGRTVHVGRAKIRKGRGRPSRSSRWSGPSVTAKQNKDRLFACWATAGTGAYFGLMHGNWIAAGFLGVAAALFGSMYLIGKYRRSTRQSRMIGRRKTKEAAVKIWATLRPRGSEHKLMHRGEASSRMRGQGWRGYDEPTTSKTARRTSTGPEAPLLISEEWKDQKPTGRRPRKSGPKEPERVGAGVERCSEHFLSFDPDCPTCLSLVR